MPLVDGRVLAAVDEAAPQGGSVGKVAEEMAALTDLVADTPRLRGVLSDAFLPVDSKRGLLRDIVGDQLGEDTLEVAAAVLRTPSATRDVRTALAQAAIVLLVGDAQQSDLLDEVEDEVFRFARSLRQAELRYALTDQALPAEQKHALIDDLLKGKATDQTVSLVKVIVDHLTGDISGRFYDLAEFAAGRRDRVVAEVRSVVELDDKRREALTKALSEATGKEVDLKVILDPSILGGIVARVGDEVLDGSVKRNLQQALYGMTR